MAVVQGLVVHIAPNAPHLVGVQHLGGSILERNTSHSFYKNPT